MIDITGLTKKFGRTNAVDDLSFTVRPGHVTDFLGPTGAGKSTTTRVLLGLSRPTAGTATIDGRRYVDLADPLRRVGALLEAPPIHKGRTADRHLLSVAQTHGLARSRVDEVLGLVGLDPDGVLWLRTLLRDLAAEGRTVLVSSHLMSEMALTAQHLVIIGRGRLLADTSVDDLIARVGVDQVLVRAREAAALRDLLVRHGATVTSDEPGALLVGGLGVETISGLAGEHRLVLRTRRSGNGSSSRSPP
ncbi:MAG: ATP-binding cassette domain-containing protein [Actinophytocola sp.]|uniref:ATP-binding cassette domain-containing protein n=1 Tax=Actinophytocola sp. TaxID=1872138 RepID=UPI001329218D|nr:ATP-binding cassette domain-containing protein [Actinophytocola sp.]MPZ82626.1 ATP-binding cassette domain-containing protein [Actinophytocola sp.]